MAFAGPDNVGAPGAPLPAASTISCWAANASFSRSTASVSKSSNSGQVFSAIQALRNRATIGLKFEGNAASGPLGKAAWPSPAPASGASASSPNPSNSSSAAISNFPDVISNFLEANDALKYVAREHSTYYRLIFKPCAGKLPCKSRSSYILTSFSSEQAIQYGH